MREYSLLRKFHLTRARRTALTSWTMRAERYPLLLLPALVLNAPLANGSLIRQLDRPHDSSRPSPSLVCFSTVWAQEPGVRGETWSQGETSG